ncbi:hypothetical protein FNV43_RR13261 [Rhamnella rubrinervis]|uniref:Uncharacterized protein n=1 Tax=Rhamnella rubrinervis TaxID=2594499 RepID=A0A8K0H0T6_9ROSA|nr:hypothetical protein FNV43_RR13261 [Rhamnella rubrinervis]
MMLVVEGNRPGFAMLLVTEDQLASDLFLYNANEPDDDDDDDDDDGKKYSSEYFNYISRTNIGCGVVVRGLLPSGLMEMRLWIRVVVDTSRHEGNLGIWGRGFGPEDHGHITTSKNMLIPLQNSLWLDSQGEDQIWKGEKETLDDYASRLQYLKSLGGRYANRAASTVCIEAMWLMADQLCRRIARKNAFGLFVSSSLHLNFEVIMFPVHVNEIHIKLEEVTFLNEKKDGKSGFETQAKIIGTVLSMSGALVAVLYKGPALPSSSSSTPSTKKLDHHWNHINKLVDRGGLLLAAEYFKLSICVVGATTLSIGIYSIIWGKAKEEEEVRADFGSDSLGSASPIGNTTPLLLMEALRWAVEYAEQCAWRWVEWETDAKEVKAAVNSKEDPHAGLIPSSILDIITAEQAAALV